MEKTQPIFIVLLMMDKIQDIFHIFHLIFDSKLTL